MKNLLTASATLLLTTSIASAGGIDRSGNPYAVLFEDGNYVELSFSTVKPEVSGDYPAALGGGSTGDMAEDYTSAGVALKYQFTDQIAVGLFLNQPYGANALYPNGVYAGLGADWESNQIAAILKYQINDNVSVYGGLRSVESQAEIAIPDPLLRGPAAARLQAGLAQAIAAAEAAGALAAQTGDPTDIANAQAAAAVAADIGAQLQGVAGAPAGTFAYAASTDADRQNSYVVGAAYERKDIALRVALTYEQGFTHEFTATETLPAAGLAGTESQFEIEMPKTVTLDFQSGVAADTLVFGSIRWSEWSVWEVRPAGYEGFTGDRVTGIDNDTTTYRLGVGRRLNDNLSVFGRVTYEDSTGDVASRLAPTDGTTSIGIGGTYTMDNIKITGGVEYAMLGDATDGSGVEFTDNTALGFGLSVGFRF